MQTFKYNERGNHVCKKCPSFVLSLTENWSPCQRFALAYFLQPSAGGSELQNGKGKRRDQKELLTITS